MARIAPRFWIVFALLGGGVSLWAGMACAKTPQAQLPVSEDRPVGIFVAELPKETACFRQAEDDQTSPAVLGNKNGSFSANGGALANTWVADYLQSFGPQRSIGRDFGPATLLTKHVRLQI